MKSSWIDNPDNTSWMGRISGTLPLLGRSSQALDGIAESLKSLCYMGLRVSGSLPKFGSTLRGAYGHDIPHMSGSISASDSSVFETWALFTPRISGSLPESLFRSSSVEYLLLTSGRLSGTLPSSDGLMYLQNLNFDSNPRLSGTINFPSGGPIKRNQGTECFAACGNKSGYCDWCGGAACCRANVFGELGGDWRADTPECKSRGARYQHVCSPVALISMISVSNTLISGTLAPLENVTELAMLFMASTRLSGTLTSFPARYLSAVLLANTFLSGSLPESMRLLEIFETLDVMNCSMTGNLANLVSNRNLRFVHLANNAFSGTLGSVYEDTWLAQSEALESALLVDNRLSGTLPVATRAVQNESTSVLSLPLSLPEICNSSTGYCTFFCDASRNAEGCIDFQCKCPSGTCAVNGECLQSSRNISHDTCISNTGYCAIGCDASRNAEGCIDNLCQCPHGTCAVNGKCVRSSGYHNHNASSEISIFTVGSNRFSGDLPEWLCRLEAMTAISLNSQQFSGTIPSCLGSLTNMTTFAMGRNYVSGSIPVSFNSLSKLETLFMFSNRFVCDFPHLNDASNLGDGRYKGIVYPATTRLNINLFEQSRVDQVQYAEFAESAESKVPKVGNAVLIFTGKHCRQDHC